MWICDGQRVHRYDPTTLQPVTAIELTFDCGNVHATSDLVITWSYNDPACAAIDPVTDVDLPFDIGKPTIECYHAKASTSPSSLAHRGVDGRVGAAAALRVGRAGRIGFHRRRRGYVRQITTEVN